LSYSDFYYISSNENEVKQIFYLLNNYEVNSFISELKVEIEKNKPQSPNDAMHILFDCEIYKIYNIIKIALQDDKFYLRNDILAFYRKIYPDKSYLTDNKIIKHLLSRIERIDKKLNQVLPKICADCFKFKIR
jgi:predicted transcriptional regulator with HTH domain